MMVNLFSQLMPADETNRHQQIDRDGVIKFLGDLDAAVDELAENTQRKTHGNWRQKILFEWGENRIQVHTTVTFIWSAFPGFARTSTNSGTIVLSLGRVSSGQLMKVRG